MKHLRHTLPLTLALTAVGLVAFGATAHAAAAVAPANGSLLDLAKPVYAAIMAGHYIACAALALILTMAALRRYVGNWSKETSDFLNSNAGNAVSTLVVSFAGAVATGAAAGVGWGGLSLHLLETSALVGVTAVGGYEVLVHVLVAPLVKRLPASLQPLANFLMGVFNRKVAPTPASPASVSSDPPAN